jgi:pyridinium-3,5-biscarboxylic acid mononucleotide sulfurtransferase
VTIAIAFAAPLCDILPAEMSTLIQLQAAEKSVVAAEAKERALLSRLAGIPSLIVALSGGADSAYLAWASHRSLGRRALSVTAVSPSFSSYDKQMVEKFVAQFALLHEFIETQELGNPAYRANGLDRCYFCKDELFSALDHLAQSRGFAAVVYGVNADDTFDFRPGHRAATEHQVLSPLLDAGLTKAEIRELSRRAGLPTWDRPASACLASRLPYGTEVTPERLALVERGEAALRELGFRQFRVRLHDKLARVEIAPDEMPRAFSPAMATAIVERLKSAGFAYVTLDLQGYRQGSLNETLSSSLSRPVKGSAGT